MPQTKCGFNDDPSGAKGCDILVEFGPTLFVDIGFDPAYQPAARIAPTPGITKVWALVDTGATMSCIDTQLAATLALPIIDKRSYGGAGWTSRR
jgi:hypothetical protein